MFMWWLVVTASITEEIRREKKRIESARLETNQTGTPSAEPNQLEEWDELNLHGCQANQLESSLEKRDSGTPSVSLSGSAELTGKLCRQVMVLIQWKVGANKAVTEHVVQALEEWLHRRGISIYTDLL
jgi:hypothetical protein